MTLIATNTANAEISFFNFLSYKNVYVQEEYIKISRFIICKYILDKNLHCYEDFAFKIVKG